VDGGGGVAVTEVVRGEPVGNPFRARIRVMDQAFERRREDGHVAVQPHQELQHVPLVVRLFPHHPQEERQRGAVEAFDEGLSEEGDEAVVPGQRHARPPAVDPVALDPVQAQCGLDRLLGGPRKGEAEQIPEDARREVGDREGLGVRDAHRGADLLDDLPREGGCGANAPSEVSLRGEGTAAEVGDQRRRAES